jgi:hypothetical protein
MENQQFIAFLKEATYQDHIVVTKENRTTTILDTTNNVEFSVTISSTNSNKFHTYFRDGNGTAWISNFLDRAIFADLDYDKKKLPDDWGEDDMLILSNKSCMTSTEDVLTKAINYFGNQERVNQKASAETGAYHRLYNPDFFSLN